MARYNGEVELMAGEPHVHKDEFLPSEFSSHDSQTNVRLFTEFLSC